MEYPKILPHQFIVMHCERRTGIVTFADGQWYLNVGDPCLVFDSLEKACQYSENAVEENPETECTVIDYQHQFLKIFIASKYGTR